MKTFLKLSISLIAAIFSFLTLPLTSSSPQPIIAKLFEFGAIYTSPLIPEIPESMIGKLPQAQIDEMHRRRGIVLTNATMEVRQASPRRQQEDSIIREHGYIRVHLSPKRFPVFYQVNWEQRVIAHGPDYVIIDKPAYLPVAPTVDNILESSLAGAARSIGATEPLLITSRLDQATEGVLVLGKSPDFVQRFNSVVRGSTEQYKKLYRALVAIPPPLGHLHHYVKMKCRRVGTPYFTLVLREESADQPKVYPCELIVRSVESVDLGPAAQERFPGAQNAYEVLIELVTGRTHQIRAQLSAVGSPLLGDDLYGPLSDPIIRSVSLIIGTI